MPGRGGEEDEDGAVWEQPPEVSQPPGLFAAFSAVVDAAPGLPPAAAIELKRLAFCHPGTLAEEVQGADAQGGLGGEAATLAWLMRTRHALAAAAAAAAPASPPPTMVAAF